MNLTDSDLLRNFIVMLDNNCRLEFETENTRHYIAPLPKGLKAHGNYGWTATSKDNKKVPIDYYDHFPRVFFNFEFLIQEISVWLEQRNEKLIITQKASHSFLSKKGKKHG